MTLFLFIVGACVGSFLGALTWRWPRAISINDGRSRCPHCKNTISWYDNIPILSYLLLRGRCRNCKKPIPRRDFLIELGTAIFFPLVFWLMPLINKNIVALSFLPTNLSLVIALLILTLSIGIFVVDLEHQYIPDTFVFLMLAIAVFVFLITDNSLIYKHLLSGFGAALFLLSINLITLGRGMGLGDVKLALSIGMILGFPLSVVWMFLSFVLGSVIGILMIGLKLAKLKQKIAFGPFLIIGFLITSLVGYTILDKFYLIY